MKYEYWGVKLADSKLASNHTNHIKIICYFLKALNFRRYRMRSIVSLDTFTVFGTLIL